MLHGTLSYHTMSQSHSRPLTCCPLTRQRRSDPVCRKCWLFSFPKDWVPEEAKCS